MSACKAVIDEVRKAARTKDVETSEGRILKPKTVGVLGGRNECEDFRVLRFPGRGVVVLLEHEHAMV